MKKRDWKGRHLKAAKPPIQEGGPDAAKSGNEKSPPYSYHTFLFPFLWDDGGRVSRAEFTKALPEEWQPDDILREKGGKTGAGPLSREGYATFQYFNEASRKALFLPSEKESIADCLYYEPLTLNNNARYVITKEAETYELGINAVRLKLFNTGVAVMVFELEYDPPAENRTIEKGVQAVMRINEFGRRLFPAYMPREDGPLICADKLAITRTGEDNAIADDFRELTRRGVFAGNPKRMPNIIMQLLGSRITNWSADEGLLHIEPAIDDRMFVCCCVSDGDCVDHFLGYKAYVDGSDDAAVKAAGLRRQAGKWAFMEEWELGCELYALLNIDPGKGASSCQSRQDLDRYLSEQLYTRWAEYGTLYGVTNHSFVCLTGLHEFVQDTVIDPFLTLYTQICILTLVQRASLISFGKEISVVAAGNMRRMRAQNRLTALQKRIAVFQSELLLSEVTPQIQGIELYGMLQEMLFIPNLRDSIQSQMGNLFEIVENIQGNTLNTGGLLLAITALLISIYQGSEAISPDCRTILITLLIGAVSILLGLVFVSLRRKK